MSLLKFFQGITSPSFRLNTGGAIFGKGTDNGLGLVRRAKMIYSFAADGGAIGAITPKSTATLPANAIILGGIINVTTAVTSLGSATVAIGTTAGSAANSLLAATAKATLSLNALLDPVPIYTAATAVKLTAAGSLNITVAVAALTAGVIEVEVFYVHANG